MNIQEQVLRSKAIFFDLFHTLFSFKSDGTNGRTTSEVLGIPESIWNDLLFESSDARLRGLVKEKYAIIRELARSYDPSIEEGTIRLAADLREQRFTSEMKVVKDERLRALASLRASGKKLGLISNADAVEVAGWHKSPLSNHFDTVIFSFQVGYVKPEPEIYQIALDRIGVEPSDSVFVGDGSSDELRGAKELGFTTVMTTEIISSLWPEKIPLRKAHADYVITSLPELLGTQPRPTGHAGFWGGT